MYVSRLTGHKVLNINSLGSSSSPVGTFANLLHYGNNLTKSKYWFINHGRNGRLESHDGSLGQRLLFLFHHQTHHSWSHHSIQTHILIHTSRPDSHRYTLRYNESHSSRTKIQVSSMLRLVFQQWPPWVTHRCLYGSRPREKQIRSVDSANSFSNSLPF